MLVSRQSQMVASLPFTTLLANAADAAGRTGSKYASLRNAIKAWLVFEVNQGNAATVALTPLQAKDTAGTSSKAIAACPIWLCNDTSTSDAFVSQTAAASFTTDATTKDKLVVFELLPETILDIVNGFCYVGAQTGASNAANITSARVYVGTAYAGASPPSLFS